LELERLVVVGLSFGGALALEFFRRRHGLVRGLFLAGAYAGWAGSLPPDMVRSRLEPSLKASQLPPEEFAATLLPSMFSAASRPGRGVRGRRRQGLPPGRVSDDGSRIGGGRPA